MTVGNYINYKAVFPIWSNVWLARTLQDVVHCVLHVKTKKHWMSHHNHVFDPLLLSFSLFISLILFRWITKSHIMF